MLQQEKLSMLKKGDHYDCGDLIFFNHQPHLFFEIVGVNWNVEEPRYLIQQEGGAFVLEGMEGKIYIDKGFYINERLLVAGLEYSWVSNSANNINVVDSFSFALRGVIKEIKKEIYGI